MRQFLLSLILLLTVFLKSFAYNDSYKKANETYAQGNYVLAAQQYEELIKNNGFAPEIYYNLGNTYYKSNEIALSILNYERAIKLSPNFEDAKHNLELARLKVVDNIPAAETFFLVRWFDAFVKILSSNQWILLSLILFIITIIFAFLFIFGPSVQIRRITFYLGVMSLIVSLSMLLFSGIRKNQSENQHEAIIMSGVVVVKSSPDKSGTDLFQLHEGTKVEVKSDLENWVEIKLSNGNVGWIESNHIEII